MVNELKELAKILNDSVEYNKLLASIKNNSVVVNGLSLVQKRHMVFSIAEKLKRPFIFVVQNDAEIKNTILDLETFTGKEVLFLPSDSMKISGAKSKDIVIDKVKVFEKILKGETPNLVVNSDILFDRFESLTEYRAKIVDFKTGETVDLTLLEKVMLEAIQLKLNYLIALPALETKKNFGDILQMALILMNLIYF
jgi:transcription-repair coupling factor (superfamily II helicase)